MKPFKCNACGALFTTNGSLNRHMIIHVKSFKCALCGDGFRTNLLCRKHMRKIHHVEERGEPWSALGTPSFSSNAPPQTLALLPRLYPLPRVFQSLSGPTTRTNLQMRVSVTSLFIVELPECCCLQKCLVGATLGRPWACL